MYYNTACVMPSEKVLLLGVVITISKQVDKPAPTKIDHFPSIPL